MQNEMIMVHNQEMVAVEWNNERVITTAQLAKVYDAGEQQTQQNFNNHQDKFIKGKHYFLLKGQELKEFKNYFDNIEVVGKRAPHLYLWTKRGASRHCKILDTEKAWEQFDYLEETYFNPKTTFPQTELSPQLQFMINMELKQKEQEEKLNILEQRAEKQTEVIETVKQAMTSNYTDNNFSKWTSESIGAIANSKHFDENPYKYQTVWAESYKRLTEKAGCNLNLLVKNTKGRAKKNGALKTQVNAISKISVISNDKKLRELYISVIREMMIAYCVEVA